MGKMRKTVVKKGKKINVKRRKRTIRRKRRQHGGDMSLYQSLMIGLNQGLGTNLDLIPLIEQTAMSN